MILIQHVYSAPGVIDETQIRFTDLPAGIPMDYPVTLAVSRNDAAQTVSITDIGTATGIYMDVRAEDFTIDPVNNRPVDSYGSLLNILERYLFADWASVLIADGDTPDMIKFQGTAWRKEFVAVVQDRANERVSITYKGSLLYDLAYTEFTTDASKHLPFANFGELIDALDILLRSTDNSVKCFSLVAADTTNEYNLKPVPGKLIQILAYYLGGSCWLKVYDTDTVPVPGERAPVLTLSPAAMALPAVFSPAIEFKKGIGITITAEATLDDNKPADDRSCVINILYQ